MLKIGYLWIMVQASIKSEINTTYNGLMKSKGISHSYDDKGSNSAILVFVFLFSMGVDSAKKEFAPLVIAI